MSKASPIHSTKLNVRLNYLPDKYYITERNLRSNENLLFQLWKNYYFFKKKIYVFIHAVRFLENLLSK